MATDTQIRESTLRSWETQAVGAVRFENVRRLRTALRPGDWVEVERSLLLPHAMERLDANDVWVKRERGVQLRGLGDAVLIYSRHDGLTDAGASPLARSYGEWRDMLARRMVRGLRKEFPSQWAPLDSIVGRQRHSLFRLRLAELRVVAPLLGYAMGGGIERDATEMGRDEVRRFIDWGVRREVLLLRRGGDLERVLSAPRRPEKVKSAK